MTMIAIDAYRRAQKLGVSPEGALAAAFAKAALRLVQAAELPGGYATYAEALTLNRTLWTFVQADVAGRAGGLPADLRDDLLGLSLFVDKQTVRALSRPGADTLKPLIDINRNLARGLAG